MKSSLGIYEKSLITIQIQHFKIYLFSFSFFLQTTFLVITCLFIGSLSTHSTTLLYIRLLYSVLIAFSHYFKQDNWKALVYVFGLANTAIYIMNVLLLSMVIISGPIAVNPQYSIDFYTQLDRFLLGRAAYFDGLDLIISRVGSLVYEVSMSEVGEIEREYSGSV